MSAPRFATMLPVSSPEWMQQALCRGHDGDFWFPEWGGRYAATRKAKDGLNKHERRRLRQRRDAS